MLIEIDPTQQWPQLNPNWKLWDGEYEDLRNRLDKNGKKIPAFAKYVRPPGFHYHKEVGVNPDRHRMIRQKHFAYVMAKTDCTALDIEWIGDMHYSRQHGNSVDLHERSHVYWDAFKNCSKF